MNQLRAYLQLVRFPAVFTAVADIFLGFLLAQKRLDPMFNLGMLIMSSSCLYLAGMVFNDIFDREIDAKERPGRPIPSGRVPLQAARNLGITLIVLGSVAAGLAGVISLVIALALTACIFLYDAIARQTVIGPVAMGGCRFLNVLLGASIVGDFSTLFAPPQILVATAMGGYVAGVTWFARNEAGASSRKQLSASVAVINLSLAGLMSIVAFREWPASVERGLLAFLFAIILVNINRGALRAVITPKPDVIQPTVKSMLLSIIMLDAGMVLVATGDPVYGAMTAALVLPAMLLTRWVFVT